MLRPSIPCVCCVKFSRNKRKRQPIWECSVEAVATMIGFLPTQAIAFEWKPGFTKICVYMVHRLGVFRGLNYWRSMLYNIGLGYNTNKRIRNKIGLVMGRTIQSTFSIIAKECQGMVGGIAGDKCRGRMRDDYRVTYDLHRCSLQDHKMVADTYQGRPKRARRQGYRRYA